jgi:alcohol dehydrogenase
MMIDTVARSVGAHHTIDPSEGKTEEFVKRLADGKGCDTVIEDVGILQTFDMCWYLVAPGGLIVNVGVHGTKADSHSEILWAQNMCATLDFGDRKFGWSMPVAITIRLIDTVTTLMILKLALAGKLDPSKLTTHGRLLAAL